MSTGSTAIPERAGKVAGRRLPSLRDARIRSKLAIILVVPVAAVLALATVRLVDVGRQAYDATLVRNLTELSTRISDLTHHMHRERMAAAQHLSVAAPPGMPYAQHVARTDERIDRYNAARRELDDVPPAVQTRLRRIDDHLQTINATRRAVVDRDEIAVSEVVLRYGVVITDLVGYSEVLGQFAGDDAVADGLRAVAAFGKAKAGTAEQQAVAFAAGSAGLLSEEQYASLVATQTSQQEALLAFFLAASPAQRSLVDSTVTGDAVVLADQVALQLSRSVGRAAEINADQASAAIGAVADLMRWTELRLEGALLADAESASQVVIRRALIEAGLVLLTLLVAVALAVALARSLNGSLRRLREGALAVANRDLPDAVARLRDVRTLGDGAAEDIMRQVRDPIRLSNRDEIGQVAQAFNVVHREAVRIAAEQAALRTSVSAMFLNLARRSQALVDRMIGELDQIERGEEDPKRLAQLFELDHLATRMRRNDENLLVLAGADSSVPRRENALLVDALRAAQSEVELYNRIEFGTIDTDVSIAAVAVNDVVRLVAELLDNATRFSPPNTVVVADGRRVRDYVVIQVEDRGLGMSEEQMATLNRRLAQPPGVDVAAFRLMGLAVVGRLASRYGIRVELRANLEGGTIAQVTLPSSTVVLSNRAPEPAPARSRPLAVEGRPSGGGWSEHATAGGRTGTAILAATESRQRGDGMARSSLPAEAQPALTAPTVPGPFVAAPMGTPTVAYPTVQPPAAPGGAGTPAAAPPRATGWGAALAAMPAPPPPAPVVEERVEAPIFREMEAHWFRGHGPGDNEEWSMPTAGYAPPPTPGAGGSRMTGAGHSAGEGRPVTASPSVQSAPAHAAPVSDAPRSAPGPASSGPIHSSPVRSRSAPPLAQPATPPVPAADRPARSATGGNPPGPPAARPGIGDAPAPGGASVPRQRTGPDQPWRTAADKGWERAMAAADPATAGTTRSGLPKRVPQAQLVPGGVEPGTGELKRRTPDEVRGLLSAYHRGVQRGRTAGNAEAAAADHSPQGE